jgi:hypothetical protein
MKMHELVILLSNKLATLNNARLNATLTGDVALVLQLDHEIIDTQDTLNQLQAK